MGWLLRQQYAGLLTVAAIALNQETMAASADTVESEAS
jgi:hypothetical protein